ncbi:hypothetical protein DPMN_143434 [Dreissena polymorpha]|uniref:Aldehyde dehydrogenase domain-containing protein n=1 Tax=Dreissena polymorpha TaxID=45954 RepID=A0A9D4GDK6_DREPO|nr:hypothetical protein DPMN_143434 [Dreissena polymorpha]
MAAAAKSNLKRVTLELGGKSPVVIFKDANRELDALILSLNVACQKVSKVN